MDELEPLNRALAGTGARAYEELPERFILRVMLGSDAVDHTYHLASESWTVRYWRDGVSTSFPSLQRLRELHAKCVVVLASSNVQAGLEETMRKLGTRHYQAAIAAREQRYTLEDGIQHYKGG